MSFRILGLIVIVTAATACGSENKPPPRAAADPIAAAPRPAPAPPPAPPSSSAGLTVSKDIRDACKLPESRAYFAYKSSKIRSEDRPFLKELATCFTTGALANREMKLVGHADPRGSEAFNLQLGKERAEAVKLAMVSLGMRANQLATGSRGKLDATGSDEVGWAKDRRVEAAIVQ